MSEPETIRISKFLSLVLRHQPETAFITLDAHGWVPVDDLFAGCKRAGTRLDRDILDHVVGTNPKKRFEYSADGKSIRASQGHSVEVDLQYTPQTPPPVLYHGTATRFLDEILTTGLNRMKRHHVHLSSETRMTLDVGGRHGKAVLLAIDSEAMHRDGHLFCLSTNNVWLVEQVPAKYISVR